MRTAAKITAFALAATLAAGLTSCGKSFDYSATLDENGFFKDIKASEIVTLPNYKGIDMDKDLAVASQEDIDEQIAGLIAENPSYEQITDRTVVDGDMLNIDYVGSVDGVEFAGGTTNGNGTIVTIGVTNYIDDFLYQLIGHKPGETVNVEVTFPENYGNEELNGKDALFVTKINYICGEELEPELTDEIAASYGFTSKDELVSDIERWLVESQISQFTTEVLSKATCENIPQSVIDYMIDSEMEQISAYAAQYGMTLNDYIASAGYDSKKAYIEASADYYKENALLYLAAQAIAELEGITVTDDIITEAGVTDEEIETYGKPYVKHSLLYSKLIPKFIADNANLIEVTEETEENVTEGTTEE